LERKKKKGASAMRCRDCGDREEGKKEKAEPLSFLEKRREKKPVNAGGKEG